MGPKPVLGFRWLGKEVAGDGGAATAADGKSPSRPSAEIKKPKKKRKEKGKKKRGRRRKEDKRGGERERKPRRQPRSKSGGTYHPKKAPDRSSLTATKPKTELPKPISDPVINPTKSSRYPYDSERLRRRDLTPAISHLGGAPRSADSRRRTETKNKPKNRGKEIQPWCDRTSEERGALLALPRMDRTEIEDSGGHPGLSETKKVRYRAPIGGGERKRKRKGREVRGALLRWIPSLK